MDVEGYWFKNVLNPKHPYHKNYLAVMQDPILNHPKVWDWTSENHDRDARYHPSAYSEVYVDLLSKLLVDENAKMCLQEKLQSMNIHNVAIYGAWKYGKICFEILSGLENVSVKYFIVLYPHAKPHKNGIDILYSHFYEVMILLTVYWDSPVH